MAKYKVGDELIIVNDPTKEKEKLKVLWQRTGVYLTTIQNCAKNGTTKIMK